MHPITANNSPLMIKPPTMFLAFIMVGLVLNLVMPLATFPDYVQYLIGPFLIAEGLVMIGIAIRQLKLPQKNSKSNQATPTLVTQGIYRFSRNPIYLGMFLGCAGIALLSSNAWLLMLELPLFLIMQYGVILREEEKLSEIFKEKYVDYQARTRRWI